MGVLVAEYAGLSTLGSEAAATPDLLNARLLVSSRDDGPGLRRCCELPGIGYSTVAR
ncbi:MAG: hypothetical protein ACRD0Z_08110 [Acidimicrobiales bacterium]